VITSAAPLAGEEKNVSSPTVEAGEQEVYESIFKDTENYIVFDGSTYIKSSLYRE